MKFIISAALFLITTAVYSSPEATPLIAGSITYPIVNASRGYTFTFTGAQFNPSSGGPSCTVCRTSNCANLCPSLVSNPETCLCSLAPNGYQWLDNMLAGKDQSFSVSYQANDASGNYVGSFTVSIDVDNYKHPEILNEEGGSIVFSVEYVNTSNNSTYSGPCWAIILAPI